MKPVDTQLGQIISKSDSNNVNNNGRSEILAFPINQKLLHCSLRTQQNSAPPTCTCKQLNTVSAFPMGVLRHITLLYQVAWALDEKDLFNTRTCNQNVQVRNTAYRWFKEQHKFAVCSSPEDIHTSPTRRRDWNLLGALSSLL